MKPLVSLATLLLLSVTAISQKDKDIPEFGKIEKSELEMKDCDFDKNASVMNLLDYANIEYDRGVKSTFAMKKEVRTRIKILQEKGLERANIKIGYYHDDSYERIQDIDAYTYNLDASGKIIETKVDKKSLFRQKLDAERSELTFTFPEVKIGSVLEYRYTIVREAFHVIDPWIFQDDVPTKLSVFTIAIPEYFQFITNRQISYPLEEKKNSYSQSITARDGSLRFTTHEYKYKMRNVPALKSEPYMGAYRDYLQRIEFQLSLIVYSDGSTENVRNTWEGLTKELIEGDLSRLFGAQIRKNLPKDEELSKQVNAANSKREKLLAIYKLVQKRMEWNGVEDFYCEDIKSIWSKGSGSTGDINMVLLNLLREYGIEAYPTLASTRDHGKVISAFPFLRQFNILLVLAQVDDKVYVLNAADKYNPATLIPYDVLNTEAFIVDKSIGGFTTLWDDAMSFKHYVILQGSADDSDNFKGEAQVHSFNYAKNPRVKSYKDGKDKFISKYLNSNELAIKIEDLNILNAENDSLQLEQKFKFSQPITSSGDYKYFSLNIFTGLEKNPFVADTRQTEIDFGYRQNYMMTGSIAIPAGYAFEELPKNITMIMPDTSIVFRRVMEANNERLSYRITLEFRRPFYVVDEYSAFKDFYQKLFAQLNEQIVIRKKTIPKP